jgi:exosortase/archaeosortase family protein
MTSLQSSLMATVFLGEYFGLSLSRRVLLPVLGALVAIGANCARVYALSAIADAAGESALEHYHDLLGRTETIVIMVLIFIVALALAPRKGVRRGMKKEEAEATRIFLLRAGSFRGGYGALLAFAAVPVLTSSWGLFRERPTTQPERPQWQVHLQASPPWQIQGLALTPDEHQILGFTEGEGVSIRGPAAREATLYHFFWKSDEPNIAPYHHTPDVCMPTAGWVQRGSPVNVSLRVHEVPFAARLHRFERAGQEMAAFETVWVGGEVENELTRFNMIGKSPRGRGVEVLEMFLPVLPDEAAQVRAAEEILSQAIEKNPRPL